MKPLLVMTKPLACALLKAASCTGVILGAKLLIWVGVIAATCKVVNAATWVGNSAVIWVVLRAATSCVDKALS